MDIYSKAEQLTAAQGRALVAMVVIRRGSPLDNAADWFNASDEDLSLQHKQATRLMDAYRAQAECGGRPMEDYRNVRRGRWLLSVLRMQRAGQFSDLLFFIVREAMWAAVLGDESEAEAAEVAALERDLDAALRLDDLAAEYAVKSLFGPIRAADKRLWVEGVEARLAETCKSAVEAFRAACA